MIVWQLRSALRSKRPGPEGHELLRRVHQPTSRECQSGSEKSFLCRCTFAVNSDGRVSDRAWRVESRGGAVV